MKISFIGFGNIAKAMAQGLLQNKTNELFAAAPSLPISINEKGIKTNSDNLAVLADADIIILAIKPALMKSVFTQIKSKIPDNCLVITVASGISLAWFAKQSPKTAVVRAMPNIAASIGESATPLIANALVTKKQRQCAEQIFTSIGLITWTENEAEIDAFTALSGSGPAYVFMFMEAMVNAATDLGISQNIATSFALQTFNGALNYALKSKQSLTELRQMVTSPAGTTAAALDVLKQHHFDELIHKAMKAAHDRAQELGRISEEI